MRGKRAGRRSRTVPEDWLAWIPNEMDQLFDSTRSELESSNIILSITLDEALSLCKSGQIDSARDLTIVFAGLFDRLAVQLCHVLQTIKEHGTHFGIVPNVKPLDPANFRGEAAQRLSFISSLLAKVVFRERTRFFHKLYSLDEIIAGLQQEAGAIVGDIAAGVSRFPARAWQDLEILGYDLNTCSGETTVILKSFFCGLPSEELEAFRQKLTSPIPTSHPLGSGRTQSFQRK